MAIRQVERRTDVRLAAMVDTAAGSCRVRQLFWENLSAKGFEFALSRLGRDGVNAVSWCNAIRTRYKELTDEPECTCR